MLTVTSSCGQGRVTVKASENYITQDIATPQTFTAIDLKGSMDVEYRESGDGTTKVYAYGSDNVLPYLDVTVNNGTLRVSTKKGVNIIGKSRLTVYASSPELRRAAITGSGDIEIKSHLTTEEDLEFRVTGSGDIDQESGLKCRGFTAVVTGSGDISIDGVVCEDATLNVTGSGDIDIDVLVCDRVNAEVIGSGDIEIGGTADMLSAVVSGSGDISASGLTAKAVDAKISGSGDISCHPQESLTSRVSGSGTVWYVGAPAKIDSQGRKGSLRRR